MGGRAGRRGVAGLREGGGRAEGGRGVVVEGWRLAKGDGVASFRCACVPVVGQVVGCVRQACSLVIHTVITALCSVLSYVALLFFLRFTFFLPLCRFLCCKKKILDIN